ncbi:MAG: hypothetical protein ACLFWL_00830 [Candidatus Brocadiia bacterium]
MIHKVNYSVFVFLLLAMAATVLAAEAEKKKNTDAGEKNKDEFKVVKPQWLPQLPEQNIPVARGQTMWVCQDCGEIRTTKQMSKESDAKLASGKYKCPNCGSKNFRKMPRSVAALRFKPISKNLIANHSFEKGRWWPYKWEPVDRLGSFWVKGGSHGKRCIKMDTRISEKQWLPFNGKIITNIRKLQERLNWRAQFVLKKCPLPDPPKPQFTSPPHYDAVGGLHGIHYKGPFIRHRKGAIYRVTVDARVKQQGGAKVFVKGFIDQKMKTTEGIQVIKRNAYRAPMGLHGLGRKWKRFSRILHPAKSRSTVEGKRLEPQWIQVQLYSYWPVGVYYWDNVRLEIIGFEKEEFDNFSKHKKIEVERESPKRMEDDFPVF